MLVPPRNSDALANALCRFLSDDEELSLWRSRAQEGIENYRVGVMAREVLTIYKEFVEMKKWRRVSSVAWLK
jgi:glycosyltransferase involved in cell wall biosynthesis